MMVSATQNTGDRGSGCRRLGCCRRPCNDGNPGIPMHNWRTSRSGGTGSRWPWGLTALARTGQLWRMGATVAGPKLPGGGRWSPPGMELTAYSLLGGAVVFDTANACYIRGPAMTYETDTGGPKRQYRHEYGIGAHGRLWQHQRKQGHRARRRDPSVEETHGQRRGRQRQGGNRDWVV